MKYGQNIRSISSYACIQEFSCSIVLETFNNFSINVNQFSSTLALTFKVNPSKNFCSQSKNTSSLNLLVSEIYSSKLRNRLACILVPEKISISDNPLQRRYLYNPSPLPLWNRINLKKRGEKNTFWQIFWRSRERLIDQWCLFIVKGLVRR